MSSHIRIECLKLANGDIELAEKLYKWANQEEIEKQEKIRIEEEQVQSLPSYKFAFI
jgi:hypothetical protein